MVPLHFRLRIVLIKPYPSASVDDASSLLVVNDVFHQMVPHPHDERSFNLPNVNHWIQAAKQYDKNNQQWWISRINIISCFFSQHKATRFNWAAYDMH
jgi:hypothetical protein